MKASAATKSIATEVTETITLLSEAQMVTMANVTKLTKDSNGFTLKAEKAAAGAADALVSLVDGIRKATGAFTFADYRGLRAAFVTVYGGSKAAADKAWERVWDSTDEDTPVATTSEAKRKAASRAKTTPEQVEAANLVMAAAIADPKTYATDKAKRDELVAAGRVVEKAANEAAAAAKAETKATESASLKAGRKTLASCDADQVAFLLECLEKRAIVEPVLSVRLADAGHIDKLVNKSPSHKKPQAKAVAA